MKEEIQKLINEHIQKTGIKMYKKVPNTEEEPHPHKETIFDEQTAYSIFEIKRLTKEGFFIEEDVGLLLFNILTE